MARHCEEQSDEAIQSVKKPGLLRLRLIPASEPISLVYPQTRHLSPKVRAFVDFMVERFR